jgi:hypothetical protein
VNNRIFRQSPTPGNRIPKPRRIRRSSLRAWFLEQQDCDDHLGMYARQVIEEHWPHLLSPAARALKAADRERKLDELLWCAADQYREEPSC